MRKRPASERFWEKVLKSGPVPACRPDLGECWTWLARFKKSNGGDYAAFTPSHGSEVLAVRFAYQELIGPPPEGMSPDHLCKNAPCVNPHHIEFVTVRENILRSNNMAARYARRTHCDNGHPFTPENTRITAAGARLCRTCRRATSREEKARLRAGRPDRSHASKTHCKFGHPYDAANTYITGDGRRRCRACNRERANAKYQRLKAERAS